MTHDGETPSRGQAGGGKVESGSSGSDFDRRLATLRNRLAEEDRSHGAASEGDGARADAGSLGQAMRLSSEFVIGIVGGGAIGWVIDYLFGTKPWAMIVFLLLGFLAGIRNVMRASGFLKKAGSRSDAGT